MRIFLDANVLFSAAKSDGAIRELLQRTRAAGHVLCADAYVVTEAMRNIALKYPQELPTLNLILSYIEVARIGPARLPVDIATHLPEKDRPVLAGAIRLRCAALVTGDRTHFGSLYGKVVHGVAVHSPHSLAQALGLA
jgi:predicted nucleic acid-binding protein